MARRRTKCKVCGKKLSSHNRKGMCFHHAVDNERIFDSLSEKDKNKIKKESGIYENVFEALFDMLTKEVGDE